MRGCEAELDGVNVYISRSGYTGEDGFEISIPNNKVENFMESLIDNSK